MQCLAFLQRCARRVCALNVPEGKRICATLTEVGSNFAEATSQTIDLPDEDPFVFKYLQLWLYTDSILEGEEDVKALDWSALLKIYG